MSRRVDHPLTTILGWRLPDWLLAVGPAMVIVIGGAGGLAVAHRAHSGPRLLLAVGLLVNVVAILLRHRAPLVVLAVVAGLSLALGYGPVVMLPLLLAVFTVAEYTSRRTVVVAAAATAGAFVATQALHGGPLRPPSVLSGLFAIGLAVAVGLYLRTRADYIIGLRERADRLERERELQALQAVGEERVRIARELHDVVAHNVSLMVVQAQALAATGAGTEQRQALDQVADLGREALSEMHRMLGVLRVHNGGAPEREPQPGVRDLDSLVERARQTGLQASLHREGAPRELPAAVDLSAFRIVQEALTNVIRHAEAQTATVTLGYRPDALEVIVLDDGKGAGAPGASADGGHGLVGMRERAALFGGSLEAAPRVHGQGYRVRAVLPTH